MKEIIFAFILILSTTSFANTKLIIDQKVYTLHEQKQPTCGESKGGPEYLAAVMLMGTAQGLAEQDGSPEKGIQAVFKFIRAYPSKISSSACTALREECESRCLEVLSQNELCKIECNQYESWNR